MKRWFVTVPLLAGVLLCSAADARAEGRDISSGRLPFTEDECRALIARGAPFEIGDPGIQPGCFVAIIINGVPLPFDEERCRALNDRGAPFQISNPEDGPVGCFVAVTPPARYGRARALRSRRRSRACGQPGGWLPTT